LLLGLRAAADLAAARGDAAAARWAAAAKRLSAAIVERFGATGYRRYPDRRAGPDSAIAFLSAPLAGRPTTAGCRWRWPAPNAPC